MGGEDDRRYQRLLTKNLKIVYSATKPSARQCRNASQEISQCLEHFDVDTRLRPDEIKLAINTICSGNLTIRNCQKLLKNLRLESQVTNRMFVDMLSVSTSYAAGKGPDSVKAPLFLRLYKIFLSVPEPENLLNLFSVLWPFIKKEGFNTGVIFLLTELLQPQTAQPFQVEVLWKLFTRGFQGKGCDVILLLLNRFKEVRPDLVPMQLPMTRISILRQYYGLKEEEGGVIRARSSKKGKLIPAAEPVTRLVKDPKTKSMLLDTDIKDVVGALPNIVGPRTASSWFFNRKQWHRLLLSSKEMDTLEQWLHSALYQVLCESKATTDEEKDVFDRTVEFCEYTATVFPFLPSLMEMSLKTPNCYEFLPHFLRLVSIWTPGDLEGLQIVLDQLILNIFSSGDLKLQLKLISSLSELSSFWSACYEHPAAGEPYKDLLELLDLHRCINKLVMYLLIQEPGRVLILLTALKLYHAMLKRFEEDDIPILVLVPHCVTYQAFVCEVPQVVDSVLKLQCRLVDSARRLENVERVLQYNAENGETSNENLVAIEDLKLMFRNETAFEPGTGRGLCYLIDHKYFPGIENPSSIFGVWNHHALRPYVQKFRELQPTRSKQKKLKFLEYLSTEEKLTGFLEFYQLNV